MNLKHFIIPTPTIKKNKTYTIIIIAKSEYLLSLSILLSSLHASLIYRYYHSVVILLLTEEAPEV